MNTFYDALAPRYDALLDKDPRERAIRRRFQHLVERSVPTGSMLLDMGCGTGIDAAWFAGRGFRVIAYDISSGMIDQLRRRCAAEIERGTVVPLAAPFSSFPSLMSEQPRPDAIVSNYGVLNAFSSPGKFFGAMAPLLGAGRRLVVSTLNPFYWRDMLQRWWWTALRRSGSPRAIVTHGESLETSRHFHSSIMEAARPHFRLLAGPSLRHRLGLWRFLVFERT